MKLIPVTCDYCGTSLEIPEISNRPYEFVGWKLEKQDSFDMLPQFHPASSRLLLEVDGGTAIFESAVTEFRNIICAVREIQNYLTPALPRVISLGLNRQMTAESVAGALLYPR